MSLRNVRPPLCWEQDKAWMGQPRETKFSQNIQDTLKQFGTEKGQNQFANKKVID